MRNIMNLRILEMIQSFCSYCECVDVGQKMVFVENFPDFIWNIVACI